MLCSQANTQSEWWIVFIRNKQSMQFKKKKKKKEKTEDVAAMSIMSFRAILQRCDSVRANSSETAVENA